MRWFNNCSILLFAVAACQDNPVFGLMTEGTDGTAATTGTGPGPTDTTTTPQPTTGHGDPSTSIADTTASVDETGSSTMDTSVTTTPLTESMTSGPPDTGETNGTIDTNEETSLDPDSGTTAEPPPVCEVSKSNEIPNRLVTREGGDDFPCMNDTVLKGPVNLEGGGALNVQNVGPNCGEPADLGSYTVGTGWDPVIGPAVSSECAFVKIHWDTSDPNKCQIGTIVVEDAESGHNLLIASFFPMPYDQSSTPLMITLDSPEMCACMDMMECCSQPPPGDVNLVVKTKSVAPGGEKQIVQTNELMFHNLDSYVDPICITEPGPSVVHANWFAYKPG